MKPKLIEPPNAKGARFFAIPHKARYLPLSSFDGSEEKMVPSVAQNAAALWIIVKERYAKKFH